MSASWYRVDIASFHGSHARCATIECLVQLTTDESANLSRHIGRIATCNACKPCAYCAICALGGSILLMDLKPLEGSREESVNRAYVFALVEMWKRRHQSKSR